MGSLWEIGFLSVKKQRVSNKLKSNTIVLLYEVFQNTHTLTNLRFKPTREPLF